MLSKRPCLCLSMLSSSFRRGVWRGTTYRPAAGVCSNMFRAHSLKYKPIYRIPWAPNTANSWPLSLMLFRWIIRARHFPSYRATVCDCHRGERFSTPQPDVNLIRDVFSINSTCPCWCRQLRQRRVQQVPLPALQATAAGYEILYLGSATWLF